MHIDQLRYFLAVANSGSVNSVADQFFMTPQAINASLRKLESEYGVPLLVRSKKGITLTPQGHLFAAYAKDVLEKNEKIHLLLRAYTEQGNPLSGTLSVFSAAFFTDITLPTTVHNFTQVYPKTSIKIMQVNSGDILSHLLNDYCDLACITANKTFLEQFIAEHTDKNIKMIPLLSDRMIICAHGNHPVIQQSKLNTQALDEYLAQTNTPISFYHALFSESDNIQYPKTISSANSVELHKKLMQENKVLTCMPKMAYHTSFQSDKFVAIPLNEDNTTLHALLYRDEPKHTNQELIQQFTLALQKQFELRYGVYKET